MERERERERDLILKKKKPPLKKKKNHSRAHIYNRVVRPKLYHFFAAKKIHTIL